MDQRLLKAAREGDVITLLNLLEQDPQILQKASSVHFVDSPLHVAALSGKAHFVNQIVSLVPSLARETNHQGMIPLHLASLEGHAETVRELLKVKLDADGGLDHQCLVKDEEGWTPLHCASQKGKITVMEELIRECPQTLEQVTAKGETVLHVAVKSNQFGAVKLLVDSIRHHNLHILFEAQDQNGKIAYQLAAAKRHLQVMEALKRKDDEEEGDEIREERRINLEGECRDESTKASNKEEEMSNELHKSQEDAILVVATLITTLTYQAMANPPSTFLKDGSTRTLGGRPHSDDEDQVPPGVLALLFMIFNSCIFHLSIYILVATLRGPSVFPVCVLPLLLMLCYSILVTAFCYNAVYSGMPYAILAIALFAFYTWTRQNFLTGWILARRQRQQP